MRVICLFFVLLTSCAPAPVIPPFEYNQKCPNVCWLGINPDITTAEEARKLINSSNQIDQGSSIEDKNGVSVEWFTKQMGVNPARVGMVLDNGKVSSLNFLFPAGVQIQEFIDLLGEPDEIRVRKVEAAELTYIEYIVYFTSIKAVALASSKSDDDPSLEDWAELLILNNWSDDPNAPNWLLQHKDFHQPWLGFGHKDEYLKHVVPLFPDQVTPYSFSKVRQESLCLHIGYQQSLW